MVSIEEIDKTILELEQRDTTFATIERLAWLYTVRDHLVTPQKTSKTGEMFGSKFVCACSSVPVDALVNALDEHFEAIRMLYPKEYDAIIEKIKGLV